MTTGRVEGEAVIAEAVAVARRRFSDDRAAQVVPFVRSFLDAVAPRDLLGRDVADLYGAAVAFWSLARQRSPGAPNVRVYTPDRERHGWSGTHTVVEVVTDDMPFLVDSVTMELSRRDLGIHLIVHPMMDVRRDDQGALLEVIEEDGAGGDDVSREAFVHVEIDRQSRPEIQDEIRQAVTDVLADVRAAVADWPAMRARLWEIHDELGTRPQPVDAEELAEVRSFLAWLDDDHFTFLGYRAYDLDAREEGDVVVSQPGTGLGILRGAEPSEKHLADQPPEVRELARAQDPLNLTKANSRATVHRPTFLDYVGIKRFGPDAQVVGEWRFIGLYSSRIYSVRPHDIPVVRRKVASVLERAGFPPDSHDAKELTAILESYPRDELFETPADELYDLATGILGLQERRQVRLFVRRDRFGRYLSCLVFLPRDRYTTESRLRIQAVLAEVYDATGIEHSVRLSESVLARLHFIVRVAPGERELPDVHEVEGRLARVTRTWQDDLADALVDERGEERGRQLFSTYGAAFPAAYRDEHTARLAVGDLERLRRLDPAGDLAMSLYRPVEAPDDWVRFKLYRSGSPITLTEVLPLLEHMGCDVIDQRPYSITPAGSPQVWIHDFGLACPPPGPLDSERASTDFQEAFARVWNGDSEDDGFNRLVLRAGLTWRQVTRLRAYGKYLRQTSTRFSQAYMEDALIDNPQVARLLVELFDARFDPTAGEHQHDTLAVRAEAVETALDEVASLDQDRILRSFLHLVGATLRTNDFLPETDDGGPRRCLSFKLDPSGLPDLPRPLPAFEIFVYSPRVEGVHLRGGAVARGGLRWSDRREDFRTEVLGLAKAQTVKNAVIVPVGAKGGFVVKAPPSAAADREALRDEVEHCYRAFIGGLLDVTDNIVDGEVVPPADVVRFDGDDPYLVVAADKGTATFSDTANAISQERGFWLGDAFASGGSAGYDHKAMGITARGAWVSVRHHFRELGLDTQTTPFTVIGVGDMSGDVFGNAMLLSPHIRLVGAFDHRHVFLDPDPDPVSGSAERARLFALPRSTWESYDRDLISEGGGVWPRTAKSIPLAPQVRRVLDIEDEALTPDELISAMLRAPVDLLFNGGVGTFVKASDETHAEVGDKSSDRVRVDADRLRCKVVGEGGNLGFTQRARVEYALRGGRINTDAIDNSAGVDCSDHEVNIKILLDARVRADELTRRQRDELLVDMADEVAALVLANNDAQNEAISNSMANAAAMVEVHRRYLHLLEQRGQVDRELEFLPDDETMVERRTEGGGLVRPEFAVLLAYTKTLLYDTLLDSDLPDDPWLTREIERYFPSTLRSRYAGPMRSHPLRREIVVTQVANALVNEAGTTFLFRLGEETGAATTDIVRAHMVAREVFDLHGFRSAVRDLDDVPASVQTGMLLEARRLVERGTRWFLRNLPRPLDIATTLDAFADGAAAVADLLPDHLRGADRASADDARAALEEQGVPTALASQAACLPARFFALDLVSVAQRDDDGDVVAVTRTYFALAERLRLDWLREQISALPRETRWETLARDALREDFFTQHGRLTAEVVRQTETDHDPSDRVDGWLRRNAAQVRRCEQMLAEIQATKTTDLARLSVALREIRNLRTTTT